MSATVLLKLTGLVAVCSCLSWGTAKHVQPSRPRLAAALLVAIAAVLVSAAPALANLCESVLIVQGLSCLLGSSAFKVAALAMKRGALAREMDAGCDLWRFFGVLALPVIPTNAGMPRLKGTTAMVALKLQTAIIKITAFAAVTALGMLALYGVPGHDSHVAEQTTPTSVATRVLSVLLQAIKPLLFYVSGMALWLEVDGMGDLVDALALAMFGITAEPHFRIPFLATSMSEFWSRRWNLTMSSMLRDLVFHPICENSFFPRESRPATALPAALPDTLPDSKVAAASAIHTSPSVTSTAATLQAGSDSATASEVSSSAASGNAAAPAVPSPVAQVATASAVSAPPPPANSQVSASALVPPADTQDQHNSHHHQHMMSGASSTNSLASSAGCGFESDAGTGSLSGGGASRRRSSRKNASHMRKFLASAATFTTSGLWHELVYAHLTGGYTTRGIWTLYFLLQAPVISLEASIQRRAAKAGIKLPPWAAMIIITLIFSFFVSTFWIPPMMWALPTTCPAGLAGSPAGSPAISVFDHIRLQGARDVEGVLQLLTASGTLLSNTLFGGAAIQEVMTRAFRDARQLVGRSA